MEREKLVGLVTAAQYGDQNAMNELFNAFYNDVYYFALKTVKNADVACDVTQETFVEIIRTLPYLQEPAAFVTWMKQVAYHQCTRYFRKKKEVLVDEDENGATLFDTLQEDNAEFIPDRALDQDDFRQTIMAMLDELSEEQRAAVLLYYFDEMSIREIAAIQGVSENTVKSRLNYARKGIKKSVEDYEARHGVKLHGIGALPILLWVFKGNFAQVGPTIPAAFLAQGVSTATGVVITATATTAAVGTATGIGAAIAAIPAAVKVIVGIAATAIVLGGTAVAIMGDDLIPGLFGREEQQTGASVVVDDSNHTTEGSLADPTTTDDAAGTTQSGGDKDQAGQNNTVYACDFENGLGTWGGLFSAEVVKAADLPVANTACGTQILKAVNSCVDQAPFAVERYTDYILTFDILSSTPGDSVWVWLSTESMGGTMVFEHTPITEHGQWQTVRVPFGSLSNTELYLGWSARWATGAFYIDNISITKMPGLTEAGGTTTGGSSTGTTGGSSTGTAIVTTPGGSSTGTTIVTTTGGSSTGTTGGSSAVTTTSSNPPTTTKPSSNAVYAADFENGLGSWESSSGTVEIVKSADLPVANSAGGTMALKFTTDNYGYCVDKIPFIVEPNSTYRITCQIMAVNSDCRVRAMAGETSWFSEKPLNFTFEAATDTWTWETIRFDSYDNTELYLGWQINRGVSHTFYIDNITITKE